MLSARNILNVTISEVRSNDVSAQISAKLENGKSLKALITADSAKNLQLASGQKALMIFKASGAIIAKNECRVRTSSANELHGKITAIELGAVHAIINADCDGVGICAAITKQSAEAMSLAVGDAINVQIKATNVMIGIVE